MQSTPSLTSFDPSIIPYQKEVIRAVRKEYDYSLGTHEILLSGSVGSAKSTLLAHIVLTHCLMNSGARFLIGRLSMPALKATLLNKILEHMSDDLVQGVDYEVNITTATIRFSNGSEIISRSWSDKKYFKVRSLELSGAAIEESSENQTDEFYTEIKMRVGRLPYIKENIIIHATNPGSPSSSTKEAPFLKATNLKPSSTVLQLCTNSLTSLFAFIQYALTILCLSLIGGFDSRTL